MMTMPYPKLNALTLVLAMVFLSLSLSGCGIKPGDVEPPSGAGGGQFPHTYPDPGQ
jgi:hypothetical protein